MAVTSVFISYVSPVSAPMQQLLLPDSALIDSATRLKPLRRKTFLAGRGLLKLALLEYGFKQPLDPLPELKVGSSGKPCFAKGFAPRAPLASFAHDGVAASSDSLGSRNGACGEIVDLHFNLSHSLDLIAMCSGFAERGLDLECVRESRLREPLIKRVLGSSELEWFNSLESMAQKAAFFTQQWTLREALLKLCGMSIFSMDELQVDPSVQTISSSICPEGIIYCFELPNLAATSQMLGAEAGYESYCDLADDLGLNEIMDLRMDTPCDAILSVFVHKAELEQCQKQGLSPIRIMVQQELAANIQLGCAAAELEATDGRAAVLGAAADDVAADRGGGELLGGASVSLQKFCPTQNQINKSSVRCDSGAALLQHNTRQGVKDDMRICTNYGFVTCDLAPYAHFTVNW